MHNLKHITSRRHFLRNAGLGTTAALASTTITAVQ
ncbi:twin-arginine translocation signal domain-containing protein [Hymenobacter sp. BT507]|uniref:Twin-arginine translocation signal domain-containing protein n=1 Tax=Hymenobacter citatus TaxID=2763506 RepID=A0ABR7MLB4_9BACT|nr:twin-arginine translocation signal domain-containing protein [Hymenobacter citatus]MBC6611835.1 twin-arginine translocation signal domain-containing protein [Hymenobacter citatus]